MWRAFLVCCVVLCSASASAQCFVQTFDGSDLDGDVMHVDHNLGQQYVGVTVWDWLDRLVVPPYGWLTGVTAVSPNRVDLYLSASEFQFWSTGWTVRICD